MEFLYGNRCTTAYMASKCTYLYERTTFSILFFKTKDPLYSLSRTDNFQSCQQYVMDSITNIQEQLNQCQLELNKQLEEYSNIPVPLERIDSCLKTIVNQERQYLSKRNDDKLSRFKEQLRGKELTKLISTYTLPVHLVSHLISLKGSRLFSNEHVSCRTNQWIN